MTDRTFHKRFTLLARIGVVVFALLAGYFFWVKVAVVGILIAIVVVGMIERILHTTYTFRKVKPIDRNEEMDYLIVSEGRFSTNKNVPLCDIVDMRRAKTFFGLDECVVIEYGYKNIVTLQPDNMEEFEKEIGRKLEVGSQKLENDSDE